MALLIWLVLAVGVGASGLLKQLPMPAPQLILVVLTAASLVSYYAVGAVRNRVDRLPLKALVFFHASRLVGFYFVYLYSQGRLPYAFAVIGGRGDIIVAFSAMAVACLVPSNPARLGLFVVWNIIGSLDILFVIFTATRLGIEQPASMRELTVLPLSLLPTFLVPLVIASHILIFQRLRAIRRQNAQLVRCP